MSPSIPDRDRATAMKQRLSDVREQRDSLKERLEGVTRLVPDPEVLRGMALRRLTMFPPRSWLPAARQREIDFAAVSASYCEALADSDQDALVECDGLQLCVPAKFAEKIDLPWAVMQNTREVVAGGIMLDIGANVGQTSVPRAILGDFQAIYAAEPDPANYARLRRSVIANRAQGFVMPDRVAIGSQDAVMRFPKHGGYRSLAPAWKPDASTVEVPGQTVDSWVDRLGLDADAVSFVKTDTNGYEVHVLRGAARLLANRLAVWQIEVAPAWLTNYGESLVTLSQALRDGFTHFIDLGTAATGPRVRPTGDLPGALAYLDPEATSDKGKAPQTDLLCLNA